MRLKGRAGLSVGWITLFLIGTDLFIVSPLLPFISESYKVSPAITGWMVTIFSVTYAIFAPIFGWASKTRGRGTFITFGLLFFSFSNVLTAFSPSFTWLMISRIFVGVSVAAITPLIYAMIGDIAPSNRKGTWLSIVVSGHLTALWAGAPFGTLLEHYFGWRFVFVVMALLGAMLSFVNYKTWRYIPRNNKIRCQSERNLLSILGSVSVTTIWAISMYNLYTYLGAALYSENSFSSSRIALAVTFYGIGAVLGSLISGQLTDRFGERRISKLTLIFLTLTLVCLGIFFSSGNWIYIFLFIWALIGYAGFTSYQARLTFDYPRERGMVLSWNNTALYTGITMGSVIGGDVISNWGYTYLPYVSSVAAFIGFILSTLKVQVPKKQSNSSDG